MGLGTLMMLWSDSTGLPNEPEGQDVGVQCLESVLRVQKARTVAWDTEKEDSKVPKVVEG